MLSLLREDFALFSCSQSLANLALALVEEEERDRARGGLCGGVKAEFLRIGKTVHAKQLVMCQTAPNSLVKRSPLVCRGCQKFVPG